jgi:hypothetical protein
LHLCKSLAVASLKKLPGMLKITIPTPCHEDWGQMTPNEQGRHCGSCAKTVVDFTQMNDEEVKHFLLNRNAERVCGRFKNEQLHRISIALPQNIFELDLPWWKHFLAASLLAFGVLLFSCNTTVTGASLVGKVATSTDSLPKAPVDREIHLMGAVALPVKDTVPKTCNTTKGEVAIQPELMGDVAYIPDTVNNLPYKNGMVAIEKPKPKPKQKDPHKADQ